MSERPAAAGERTTGGRSTGEPPAVEHGADGTGGAGGTDRVEVLAERRTRRWTGLAGATVAAAVFAVVLRSAGLVLVAGLGATLLAYARTASAPPVAVAIERSFDPVEPAVGEPVTVSLQVANVGDRTIADLRLADGVPSAVSVTDGEARLATALRPGAATTVEYEIAGGRARESFGAATVAVRDVVGLVERRARVEAGTDEVAWPALAPDATLALLPPTFAPVGPLATDEGGEGLAFHGVREHRAGDPLRRIDWRQRAKTGDLATVEFQRERVATVVVIVDARPAAAVSPGDGAETAVERSRAAASALVEGVEAAGHRVGLAALGPVDCWVPPDRGRVHRERLDRHLADGAWSAGAAGATASDAEVGGSATGGPASGPEGPSGNRVERPSGKPVESQSGKAVEGSTEGGAGNGEATAAADGGDLRDADVQGGDVPGTDVLARLDPGASVVFLSPLCDDVAGRTARRLAARVAAVSVLSPDPTATDTPGRTLAALERDERLRSLRSRGIDVVDWPTGRSLEALLAAREGSP